MKKNIKIAGKIVLTIIVLIILIKLIDFNEILSIFGRVGFKAFLLYILIYIIVNIMRALRFSLLIDNRVSLYKWICITFIHIFYNRILPARTGEVSLFLYAKKIGNVEIVKSFNSLLISRLCDLISVILLFMVSLAFIPGPVNSFSLPVYIILITILAVLFVIVTNIKFALALIIKVLDKIVNKINFLKAFSKKLEKLDIESIKPISAGTLALTLLISGVQWFFLYLLFFAILRDINIDLGFNYVVVGSAFANISNLIPLSAIGGFGTMEAGWVLGFTMLGVNETQALTSGFVTNLITFIITVILGAAGMLYAKLFIRQNDITKEH